jgi:NTE family protein
VLVLGGGGVLGLEWILGALAGIEDATGFDLRECEYFVGTSAGAIVAARLAGGKRPRRPPRTGEEKPTLGVEEEEVPEEEQLEQRARLGAAALEAARRAGEWSLAVGSPLAPAALALARPAGTLLRAGVLSRIHAPERTLDGLRAQVAAYGARFDGRLRVACVERASGRRVMFGAPGSPPAMVPEAVAASCAVPWLFAPVKIGHREYVDGGVWSATNLDAAPAGRGTYVLCLNPTAGLGDSHTLVAVGRRLARSAVSVEALALRRRGAVVRTIAPSTDSSAAMGGDFMDPEPRTRVLAAGYAQGLREGEQRDRR